MIAFICFSLCQKSLYELLLNSSLNLCNAAGNVWQGSRPTLQYADIYSNPPERRGLTELEHSHCVGGAYGATTDCWKDSSNICLETTNINTKFLSGFGNSQTKCQLRNKYGNISDCHVGEKMCYESKASERDKIYLPWNSLAGTIKEFGMTVSTAPRNLNENKEVECDSNGLLAAAKSNIEVSKESKGKVSNFNLVLGESSTAFQVKSLGPHHMPTMTADKSYDRELLSNNWKISSSSDITHFNRDLVKIVQNPIVSEEIPLGFSSKNSVFIYNAAPTLPMEKSTVMKNGLQYRNVEMPAAWSMLKLSDRDNSPPVRSVQECEIIKNPCLQSPVTIAPPISKDPTQLLESSEMPKFLGMGEKSTLPSCWMGHNCERVRTITGNYSVFQAYSLAFLI